jgi:hypothetical protein
MSGELVDNTLPSRDAWQRERLARVSPDWSALRRHWVTSDSGGALRPRYPLGETRPAMYDEAATLACERAARLAAAVKASASIPRSSVSRSKYR